MDLEGIREGLIAVCVLELGFKANPRYDSVPPKPNSRDGLWSFYLLAKSTK